MKFFPLVWAMLWRKRARTILTLLSLIVAFLLLGLLQAADVLFNGGAISNSGRVLITQARVSFTSPLPLRIHTQLEAVPGVEAVSWSQFFGGIYQDPRNFFPQFAVVPERWLNVFRECALPPAQLQAWNGSRTAAVAGKELVERFHWKLGDRIPLTSQIWPQKDGSRVWAFDLVGILDDVPGQTCGRLGNMYLRYDYLDEARQFGQGAAGVYALRIADPARAEEIEQAVDAMFENSPDETKTQTERDFSLNFVRQVGDLGKILHWIMGAVFFTILMLTGNTMRQAVQERVPELAVLKTLGLTDGAVLGLVLAESLLLCVLGGLSGMVLASGVMRVLAHLPLQFPPMHADAAVWAFAAASMLALGFVVGALPAWRAQRLSIVDALADR
ncbi:MAG TPA: FtsX-like permease family protein [Candidatus Binatia bacterium]|nr:FtsX-like permease family protein [Candidatus Binatia bacterium]